MRVPDREAPRPQLLAQESVPGIKGRRRVHADEARPEDPLPLARGGQHQQYRDRHRVVPLDYARAHRADDAVPAAGRRCARRRNGADAISH